MKAQAWPEPPAPTMGPDSSLELFVPPSRSDCLIWRSSLSCVPWLSYQSWLSLPARLRPPPNSGEATVLASIYAFFSSGDGAPPLRSSLLVLATGTRCLGSSLRSKLGQVNTDGHAEVRARRALVRLLWHDLAALAKTVAAAAEGETIESTFFEWPKLSRNVGESSLSSRPRLKAGISFVLYISQPPCGLASNNLYDTHSFTPPAASTAMAVGNSDSSLQLKPGRSDLPAPLRTLSLSCSDKLSRHLLLGLQGSLLAACCASPLQAEPLGGEPGVDLVVPWGAVVVSTGMPVPVSDTGLASASVSSPLRDGRAAQRFGDLDMLISALHTRLLPAVSASSLNSGSAATAPAPAPAATPADAASASLPSLPPLPMPMLPFLAVSPGTWFPHSRHVLIQAALLSSSGKDASSQASAPLASDAPQPRGPRLPSAPSAAIVWCAAPIFARSHADLGGYALTGTCNEVPTVTGREKQGGGIGVIANAVAATSIDTSVILALVSSSAAGAGTDAPADVLRKILPLRSAQGWWESVSEKSGLRQGAKKRIGEEHLVGEMSASGVDLGNGRMKRPLSPALNDPIASLPSARTNGPRAHDQQAPVVVPSVVFTPRACASLLSPLALFSAFADTANVWPRASHSAAPAAGSAAWMGHALRAAGKMPAAEAKVAALAAAAEAWQTNSTTRKGIHTGYAERKLRVLGQMPAPEVSGTEAESTPCLCSTSGVCFQHTPTGLKGWPPSDPDFSRYMLPRADSEDCVNRPGTGHGVLGLSAWALI